MFYNDYFYGINNMWNKKAKICSQKIVWLLCWINLLKPQYSNVLKNYIILNNYRLIFHLLLVGFAKFGNRNNKAIFCCIMYCRYCFCRITTQSVAWIDATVMWCSFGTWQHRDIKRSFSWGYWLHLSRFGMNLNFELF